MYKKERHWILLFLQIILFWYDNKITIRLYWIIFVWYLCNYADIQWNFHRLCSLLLSLKLTNFWYWSLQELWHFQLLKMSLTEEQNLFFWSGNEKGKWKTEQKKKLLRDNSSLSITSEKNIMVWFWKIFLNNTKNH